MQRWSALKHPCPICFGLIHLRLLVLLAEVVCLDVLGDPREKNKLCQCSTRVYTLTLLL